MEARTLTDMSNLLAVLQEYGEKVRDKYKSNLIDNNHPASGELINSVSCRVDTIDGGYEVKLTNLQDYWKYVEYGTKPHFPPPSALLKWIEIKPVIPRPYNGKLPTNKQLAYLIGRKIATYGTQGTHDLENAIDDLNAEYRIKIEEALGKDMSEYIRKVFSK